MNRQRLAILSAVLVLTSGVAAADADGTRANQRTRSVVVSYETASLGQDTGAQALHERLEAAARHTCGTLEAKDLRARREWQTCYETALNDAVARVGHERLASVNGKRRSVRATRG